MERPSQLIPELVHLLRVVVDGEGNDVVRYNVSEEVEPEPRHLCEDLPLIRDRGGKHYVKGGQSIGSDKQERISEIVYVTNLTPGVKLDAGQVRLHQ